MIDKDIKSTCCNAPIDKRFLYMPWDEPPYYFCSKCHERDKEAEKNEANS
jgi:hypothetical protein